MRFSFIGKNNVAVTEALKEKITDKLGRIEKLFPADSKATVTLSVIKLSHTIEVTVTLPKRTLRAEVTKDDMYAAIDEVTDILENQMVKYKSRLRDKSRRDKTFADEYQAIALPEEPSDDGNEINITKEKHFILKPMDPEEAVMQMEMIGHSFFVFINSQTEDVNVVYKRNDGAYALIVPEN